MEKRILLVEDDSELVKLVSYNLKAAGYVVGTASDGVAGLKKARSWLPDLVLLDLMLPDLDGFSVCRILKIDQATSQIPIIMVTAMTGQLSRLAGLETGADDYITKPFSMKFLLARMQQILAGPSGFGRVSKGGIKATEHKTTEHLGV